LDSLIAFHLGEVDGELLLIHIAKLLHSFPSFHHSFLICFNANQKAQQSGQIAGVIDLGGVAFTEPVEDGIPSLNLCV
jgi:hypothetical protein